MRDLAATRRDEEAEARDAAAEARELSLETGAGPLLDGVRFDRSRAAEDRAAARADRHAAAADRRVAAEARRATALDELTGAHRRGPGLIELERELARAQRLERGLTVAFVDVDGLKAINDSQGHAAGDRMLRQVVVTLRTLLRAYDLIVRYGGDEFICVLPGMAPADARSRIVLVNAALGDVAEPGSVTAGLAEMQRGDSVEALVGRADQALYQERARRL